MSETTPYAAPQTNPIPQQAMPQGELGQVRSVVPKVFGILHIVYASLGLIFALFSLALYANFDKIYAKLGLSDQEIENLLAAMESSKNYTYIAVVVSIGLSILLILAGIKLLKYKGKGVQITKTFYIIRILAAVSIGYLQQVAQADYQEQLAQINHSQTAQLSPILSLMIGLVMVSIYPIVALIMLTRPNVQKDLT